MTPTERTMPILRAIWTRLHGFRIQLPDGSVHYAKDREEARAIVARELPYTAIEFRDEGARR